MTIAEQRIVNLVRELEKAQECLRWCERYFARESERNAAAHMSDKVLITPLAAQVQSVLYGIGITLTGDT